MTTLTTDPLADSVIDESFNTNDIDESKPETKPEAPYGYKPDGTPYKRNPASYTGRGTKTPGRKSTPNKATAAKGPDYAQIVMGLMQIPAAGLALGGQISRSPALVADAAAMAIHTVPLANAVDQVARENSQVAAILDKISVVGPYSALLGAVIPFAMQIMVNHTGRQVPEQVTAATGVMSRDSLIAHVAGKES